jgi:fructosamine-3-kinase
VSLPQGARVVRRVGGGDINEAYQVELADGREAFVKTRADAAPGEYAAEAAGLRWLAQARALRTPAVLAVGEDHLALEWVAPGRLSAAGEEELGRGLAQMHAAGAEAFGLASARHPADGDVGNESARDDAGPARFGSLRLPNEPTADWPSFYAQRRLLPLARLGAEHGVLSRPGVAAVEAVCARIDELCGPAEPPARLHGDLWRGNVMSDEEGRPWLIDPSAYGGHREIDLAMLRLFGTPSERVFACYGEVAPLAAGASERVGLYQLLPLLVHALLFGGSYVAEAERTAARYAR